jgi:hypothetical protein
MRLCRISKPRSQKYILLSTYDKNGFINFTHFKKSKVINEEMILQKELQETLRYYRNIGFRILCRTQFHEK